MLFQVEPQPAQCRCSACGSRNVIRRGSQNRWFRNVPFGRHWTLVLVDLPRVECQVVRQIEIGFAEPRRGYTKDLARYILDLAPHLTIKDIADHLALSWDTELEHCPKEIVKTDLAKQDAQPPLKEVRQLASDEIAIGHGHRSFTVVLDLDSGRVLFVGKGKGSEAWLPFWRRLKRARARVTAVAIDRSPAYQSAVAAHLPDAQIVFTASTS